MKKKKFRRKVFFLIILLIVIGGGVCLKLNYSTLISNDGGETKSVLETAGELLSQEPSEVKTLREQEVAQSDGESLEYYFKLLTDSEKRIYREMLQGISNRENEFYLSTSDETVIEKAYHALLKDHSELFWVHNGQTVYTSSYQKADYCKFSPGYEYTDEEIQAISQSIETALGEVKAQITDEMSTYDKIKTVYTYLIDNTEYEESDDDQNIAGVFWKKKAVCAGYARAMQYLLDKLGITCIYVEGSAENSSDGHAWNIVEIDGQYYYVDVTNGDQPSFLEGDAIELAEHKTIIYDYLCPFPDEYEQLYTASDEFQVPECTATDYNFYVLNQGCFYSYNKDGVYDYCCMRLKNGAVVVRFKFVLQEDFDAAYQEWITDGYIQKVAEYYLMLQGLTTAEYHYGVLDDLKTMYFMF